MPGLVVLAVVPAVLVALAAPASASTGDDATGQQTTPETRSASIELTVAPLVGDGPEDGDLVADEVVGLPLLSFSPSGPSEQTAMLDFTVTNTGQVAVEAVEVVDERIGVVLDASQGTVLQPGATTTVRGVDRYTFEEALVGTSGLVASDVRATATAGDGTTVEATTQSIVQVVVVLATPDLVVELAPVVGAGDVVAGEDGRPTVAWTAAAAAAEEPRELRYRVTVTNVGEVAVQGLVVDLELLGAELPVDMGETSLPAGGELTAEVAHAITPADLPTDVGDGVVGVDVVATADLRASAADGSPAFVRAEATVVAVVAPEELPAAGPPGLARPALVAALAVLLGGMLLRTSHPVRPARRR